MNNLTAVFAVAGEAIPDSGEDSFFYCANENGCIVSVFDGLGGSGGKTYRNYSGKSGAFIASRAVCGSVQCWFRESRNPDTLKEYMERALAVCTAHADPAGKLRSKLIRAFPTTASIVALGEHGADVFWAGDSRCYLLDADGLHQLTADDLDGQDAMTNLTADGLMTNVVCADRPFTLHRRTLNPTAPCILFAATDGCFGYLRSPMAFEQLLLETLLESRDLFSWKKALDAAFRSIAGDDYSLCAAVFGFSDLSDAQKRLRPRLTLLNERYLCPNETPEKLWKLYRTEYERLLPETQQDTGRL